MRLTHGLDREGEGLLQPRRGVQHPHLARPRRLPKEPPRRAPGLTQERELRRVALLRQGVAIVKEVKHLHVAGAGHPELPGADAGAEGRVVVEEGLARGGGEGARVVEVIEQGGAELGDEGRVLVGVARLGRDEDLRGLVGRAHGDAPGGRLAAHAHEGHDEAVGVVGAGPGEGVPAGQGGAGIPGAEAVVQVGFAHGSLVAKARSAGVSGASPRSSAAARCSGRSPRWRAMSSPRASGCWARRAVR